MGVEKDGRGFDEAEVEEGRGKEGEEGEEGEVGRCLRVGDERHQALFAEYAEKIAGFRLPRYEEIPQIDLYMDQLISYVDDHTALLLPKGEKKLTNSMVNNYVKQGLVPQPRSKRYTPDHVAYLLVVMILKRTLSLSEIDQLVSVQIGEVPTARAYDFFATVFEESMRALFCGKLSRTSASDLPLAAVEGWSFALSVPDVSTLTPARRLAISAATCAANGIYVAKSLELSSPDPARR